MNNKLTGEKIVSDFINAVAKADHVLMRKLLAENVVGYITNAAGGVDKVQGRDNYLQRIPADVATVKSDIKITQILTVKHDQVLVMVEINAERKGKKLINHAAFLMNLTHDQISEIWMVEALPSYSDEFWK